MSGNVFGVAIINWTVLACCLGMVLEYRRERRARKAGKHRGDAGGGMLFLFDELFEPGRRQAVEEQESKRMTREDAGTGADLDLDAGTVRLVRREDSTPNTSDTGG